MNEVAKLEHIENEISIIEESHKSEILSINENLTQLVSDCLTIVVGEDKESYEKAVELKRIIKSTHVSIEKKRKELKQPLIDYGKRLDKWVEEIYNPLVNAEKIVKKKMENYENLQEIFKNEIKLTEEKEKNDEFDLQNKLKNLNNQLEKINSAKNTTELKNLELYLDSINIQDFGKKSNEAVFILNQLKMTCKMAYRLIKDEQVIEEPKTTNSLNIEEVITTQEVLIKNEEGIFEEISLPVNNPIIEFIKVSDEDVINMIDLISNKVLSDIINLINEKTKLFLNNEKVLNNLDFSEYEDLLYIEVKKRIGVKLINK